jgi:hypothetical protein
MAEALSVWCQEELEHIPLTFTRTPHA